MSDRTKAAIPECEFDAIHDGGICWFCTGEDCAHEDCGPNGLSSQGLCDHDCSERHPAESGSRPMCNDGDCPEWEFPHDPHENGRNTP